MKLLRELKEVVTSENLSSTAHCTTLEDNKGCIDLIKTPFMRPQTKHIALKYYHYRSIVQNKTICITYIETKL